MDAVEEKKLESGYVADVAILTESGISAAIEVWVTHAVGDIKKETIGLPFIEVSGEEIIDNSLEWRPTIDKFNRFRCKVCERAESAFEQSIQSISQQTGVPIPETFYRTAYAGCWKCGKEILIFMWPKESEEDSSLTENVPRPRTVEQRYSKTAQAKYWANTCPYCKSLQGDFFLFSEPDSPLFGFHCGKNTIEDFQKDMKKLSLMYLEETED